MHPLINNLSELSDDELHSKLSELNKRFVQAYRMGPFQIIPQLQMLIEDYNAEVGRRNAKKMKEMQEKFDKAANKGDGKGMKGIIDIQ
jgi:sulfur relay (sulfurtransferase) DsrC/TusE family protein